MVGGLRKITQISLMIDGAPAEVRTERLRNTSVEGIDSGCKIETSHFSLPQGPYIPTICAPFSYLIQQLNQSKRIINQ
jgi:hypothetical protein